MNSDDEVWIVCEEKNNANETVFTIHRLFENETCVHFTDKTGTRTLILRNKEIVNTVPGPICGQFDDYGAAKVFAARIHEVSEVMES